MRRNEKKAVGDECWSRACEVTDPQRHPQDFTIYKVILKMTPVSTIEDEYEILVYKRYRQFRRLHKILSSYHAKMHRVDKFPAFPKPTVFGRFDDDVVEERRESSDVFLNFCCRHRHLFTHSEFQLFFEGGVRSNPKSALRNPVAPFDLGTFRGSDSVCSDTASSVPRTMSVAEEEEEEEGPPLVSGDGDVVDAQTERLVDVALSSPLPEPDLTFFDPCSVVDRPVTHDSNVWLLSAMDAVSERPSTPSFASETSLDGAEARPRAGSVKTFFASLKDKTKRKEGQDAYIYSAAALIRHAQDVEKEGRYEEAFNGYKTGVGILLAGVQTDSDPARREVVRQRTGCYLVHAEAIYNQFLSDNSAVNHAKSTETPELRWQMVEMESVRPSSSISDSSVMLSLDPSLSRLHFSVTELRSYKVLGILHERVMLVMDLSSNVPCVIKSVRKSSVNSEVQSCVPTNVPFMVRLLKMVETEDTLFLVLEYATGGRLYDFVRDYLANFYAAEVTAHPGDGEEGENVYTGHRLPQVGELNGRREEEEEEEFAQRKSSASEDEEGERHAQGYRDLFSQCIAEHEGKTEDETQLSIASQSSEETETEKEEEERENQEVDEGEKPRESSRSRSTSERWLLMELLKSTRRISRQRSHSANDGVESRSRVWSAVFAQLDVERAALQLPESCVRQWGAEIVSALLVLHRRGLVVADLHPRNLLLGRGGHILLSYISRWRQAPWRASSEAVDGGYAAPEVLTLDGPSPASDWFSLGVILYELLTGKAFIAAFPGGISSHSVIQLPSHVSSEAQDLLLNLLTYHSNQRLQAADIKLHPFFNGVDWKELRHH